MPTYADDWNAHHSTLSPDGPTRYTIVRGDSFVRDPSTGDLVHDEVWEREEGMDVELSLSDEEVREEVRVGGGGDVGVGGAAGRGKGVGNKARLVYRDEIDEEMRGSEGIESLRGARMRLRNVDGRGKMTLLVLDTNVLLSSLPFLRALFSHLLKLNVALLGRSSSLSVISNASGAPSPSPSPSPSFAAPLSLIIPQIVLSELDGLKTSSRAQNGERRTIGSVAREANRWVLDALREQKKVRVPGMKAEMALPESAWALHVQTRAYHAKTCIGLDGQGVTNDEQIIMLCISLSESTNLPIVFCSNDTNARTRAEVEGVQSLELDHILQAQAKGTSKHLRAGVGVSLEELDPDLLAMELVEQWMAQMGDSPATPPTGQQVGSSRNGGVDHPASTDARLPTEQGNGPDCAGEDDGMQVDEDLVVHPSSFIQPHSESSTTEPGWPIATTAASPYSSSPAEPVQIADGLSHSNGSNGTRSSHGSVFSTMGRRTSDSIHAPHSPSKSSHSHVSSYPSNPSNISSAWQSKQPRKLHTHQQITSQQTSAAQHPSRFSPPFSSSSSPTTTSPSASQSGSYARSSPRISFSTSTSASTSPNRERDSSSSIWAPAPAPASMQMTMQMQVRGHGGGEGGGGGVHQETCTNPVFRWGGSSGYGG